MGESKGLLLDVEQCDFVQRLTQKETRYAGERGGS